MVFGFFEEKQNKESPSAKSPAEVKRLKQEEMEKFGPDEECRKLMEELEASLVIVRQESENVAELGQLRRIVDQCLKFEDVESNRLAEKKDELKARALEIQKEFGKPEILKGLASKLQSNQETLPAIGVENHVEWVNENFELPFLKVGESTDFGVFLTSKVETEDKSINLQVRSRHGRSALLGGVVFEEKRSGEEKFNHELFRDVDIKGLGYVVSQKLQTEGKMSHSVGDISINERNERRSMGILNSKDAYEDKEFSEIFHRHGIRTHRVVAIIVLEEIIYRGERVSIGQAKERKLIAEDAEPVLEIRAFGTHARFTDVMVDSFSENRAKAEFLIEDARLLVAQELGIDPLEFNRIEYYKWLARTTGKNLGLMHKHGYSHKYLREGHNMTLDGRLVDFTSVKYLGSEAEETFNDEDGDVFAALRQLLDSSEFRYPGSRETYDSIIKEYDDSYKNSRK